VKHYPSRAGAFLGACLVYASTVLTLMTVASVVHACSFSSFGLLFPWDYVRNAVPLALFVVAASLARFFLLKGTMPVWVWRTLIVAAMLAVWYSYIWFQDPMHDIALFFGSHWRWGCWAPGYIVRDSTMPWFLFTPVLIAMWWHGGPKKSRSRGKGRVYVRVLFRVLAGLLAILFFLMIPGGIIVAIREKLYLVGILSSLGGGMMAPEFLSFALCGKGIFLRDDIVTWRKKSAEVTTESPE